jgi:general stress protein YciG
MRKKRVSNAAREYLAEISRRGGRIGGRSTSRTKAQTARHNGKKGGRPVRMGGSHAS